MTHEVPQGVKERHVKNALGWDYKAIPEGPRVRWTTSLRTREDIDALIIGPLGVDYIYGYIIERNGRREPVYADCRSHGDLFDALAQEGVLQGEDRVTRSQIEFMDYMKFGRIVFNFGVGQTEKEKTENIRTLINGIDRSLLTDFVGIDVSVDPGEGRMLDIESYRYIPGTRVLEKREEK